LSEGRNSGGSANTSLSARNAGSSEGGWHSFALSSGASARGASGFVGGASRVTPGFGGRGYGWGGGYGWGRGYGWGWGGWGFGFGWPYWGFGWGLGWAPWWYNPYWYAPWPAYGYPYYSDYWYDWSDDPPPYRPDSSPNSSYDPDSQGSSLITPSLNYDDDHFNLNSGASLDNSGSVQNVRTPQPEAAPNSPAPATPPQPRLVSEPQT